MQFSVRLEPLTFGRDLDDAGQGSDDLVMDTAFVVTARIPHADWTSGQFDVAAMVQAMVAELASYATADLEAYLASQFAGAVASQTNPDSGAPGE
jgi:hypothetical protein